MDPLSSDTWKQEWTAFWSAPWVVGPLLLIIGSAAWWFRGKLFEAQVAGLKEQIAGLKEQIAVVEQRLKLAAEGVVASAGAKDELEKQFLAYKAEVSAKGSNASPAKMDAAIIKVANGNTLVGSELMGAIQSLDFAQYGALKKLDYETLKKLEGLGKPFINIDPTKKR